MIQGEAGGQHDDTLEQALLSAARNRFGNSGFGNGNLHTWQVVLGSTDFQGTNTTISNGPDMELANAASVYSGDVGDIVAGAACFWSPLNWEWDEILYALDVPTAPFPSGLRAPGCFGNVPKQIVYKTSIGLNLNPDSNQAPAFIFLRPRPNPGDRVVIQIP